MALFVLSAILLCWSTTASLGQKTTTRSPSNLKTSVVEDFCQWQTFNGTCPQGSVIIIEHALYGRMRFGRCLDRDYGYLGCSASVQRYAEQRCSGRRRCHISLPDNYLDTVPKPCPADLKAYLELSYHCLDVETAGDQTCRASADGSGVRITKPVGYLSNYVTAETNKGSSDCPWILEGKPGQRFTLSLVDYGSPPGDEKSEPPSAGGWVPSSAVARGKDVNVGGGQLCHIYAQIHEATTHSNIVVCSGQQQQRDQVVYTSESNIVRVEVVNVKTAINPAYYLIKFEVTGCADYVAPPGAIVNRHADRSIVRCDADESVTWELRCELGRWTGRIYNCTDHEVLQSGWTFDGLFSNPRLLSRHVIIVVIVGIALIVSIFILVIGIVAIRRRRCLFRQQFGLETTDTRATVEPDGGTGRYKGHQNPMLFKPDGGTGRYKDHQYPMLLKPDGIYPSSRPHPRDVKYTTTTSSGGSNALMASRPQPSTGGLFVADYYTGYTSVDCPAAGGGTATGAYPVSSAAMLSMTSTRLTGIPGSRGNYDVSGDSFDDGLSMAQRFYSGGAEHIYESPKFDRKSTDYDGVSVDDGNDASARFKLTQHHPLTGHRLHSTGQDGGSNNGGTGR